jgi:membrane protein required for colicin V production
VNGLDFVLLLTVGISILTGFWSGFARTGIAFAALLAGILVGFWTYGIPAAWIEDYVRSKTAANLLGFFFVLICFILAGALVGWALSKLFKWTGLSWLDRMLGGAFGLVRGTFLCIALVAVLTAFAPKPPPRWMAESRVLPYVLGASSVCAALAPQALKDAFHDTVRELERIWQEHMRGPTRQEKLEERKV